MGSLALALLLLAADNPATGGANASVTVSTSATALTPSGCTGGYITVVNTSTTPVYTGLTNGVTTSTGVPVCRDLTACVGSAHTRRVASGVVYGIVASGTQAVRVECGDIK